jgi:hypothetical protein
MPHGHGEVWVRRVQEGATPAPPSRDVVDCRLLPEKPTHFKRRSRARVVLAEAGGRHRHACPHGLPRPPSPTSTNGAQAYGWAK